MKRKKIYILQNKGKGMTRNNKESQQYYKLLPKGRNQTSKQKEPLNKYINFYQKIIEKKREVFHLFDCFFLYFTNEGEQNEELVQSLES